MVESISLITQSFGHPNMELGTTLTLAPWAKFTQGYLDRGALYRSMTRVAFLESTSLYNA